MRLEDLKSSDQLVQVASECCLQSEAELAQQSVAVALPSWESLAFHFEAVLTSVALART